MQRRRVAALLAATCGPAWAGADLCRSGRRQSPVDIVAPQRAVLPPLAFDHAAAAARLDNDGHTVRVRLPAGSALRLGGERLPLQQFHFHIPGGERIAGEDFPLALHFLHKRRNGQLVAVVALFRIGAEHPALAALLPQMPGRGAPPVPAVAVNPAAWLPTETGHYAYDGSLTAPPCTEGVRWLVLKQVQTLSAAQWVQLQSLFPHNARPVQPLHGRRVQQSS